MNEGNTHVFCLTNPQLQLQQEENSLISRDFFILLKSSRCCVGVSVVELRIEPPPSLESRYSEEVDN